MKRTKERLKGEIFRALESKIIDLLRDESQRNDGGAGDNKEPHEKYFVEPEEVDPETNSNSNENEHYLNGYGEVFQPSSGTTSDEEHVLVDGAAFGYGQEFSYSPSSDGSGGAVISYNAPQKPSQISCWTCDASNWNECAQVGFLEACDAQITACSITSRMRNGEVRSISAGCKARDACESDKLNNFAIFEEDAPHTSGHQCRPDSDLGPSVCRQCCYSNNCNFMLDFVDELGWSQVLF
ncbi:Oidioi.mRNA.OKI2018_I69.XSR.g14039.t1.cds [Oikopleura dioica]|uniref:Oidioi.mRNA.OKI2018_I69.XSR.g14039.t1.cds n=1 Tax=Oikopleura dioica TaxID=34765 RepID=A0ABN7SCK1_OIKDI|nr:Oidioi.mRNA.OKI2018_I69.XSR.g14039.t1.cds [Oikopleura dioica]